MHHNLIEEDLDIGDEEQQADSAITWQLVCLTSDEAGEPAATYPITLKELRLFQVLARRLNLVITRDDKRKRLFVSNGFADDLEDEEIEEDEEPATPVGSIRYPSGWVVEVVDERDAGSGYEVIDPAVAAPLIPAFPDAQLSEHFELSEFRPGEHSYNLIRISPALIQTLEVIRERVGEPVFVTSGYRPIAYNRKIGGVPNSAAIDGMAADIYTEGMSNEDLHAICEEVIGDRGGVALYPSLGFVRVDLRGYRARWSGS